MGWRSLVAVLVCVSASTLTAVSSVEMLPQRRPEPPTSVRVVGLHPVNSNVAATNVTTSAATITWNTDVLCDSQVEYGPTTLFGSTTPLNTTPRTSHSVTITGLNSNTLYHFRVYSRDSAGNLAISGRFTFTTAASSGPSIVIGPQDTSLNLNATNYSTATTLTTYTWPDRKVANAIVMTFDLSSLPAGVTVQDATLTLGLVESDTTPDATYAISAHKIVGRNPVITAATGYTADGATAWTANPCCSNSVPMAQADISSAYDTRAINKTLGLKSWTITSMVQEWVSDPGTNFGVLLNSDVMALADRYRYFASMEHADSTLRPSLRISYTVPPPDSVLPTVSMSAPAAGAVVSGTVAVTAAASDNVGVTSVQFQLDGANLGAADTSAPYSISWNTSTAAAGTHTLRAVARDAAGNQRTSAGVTVTVSNPTGTPGGIAALYPGDVGIESHPDVIFTEMFEQATLGAMTSRYTDVNHSAGMSFVSGVPAGSSGTRALQMTTNGGSNEAAGLYKTFPNDQQWYLRYYINYNSSVEYGHTSAWIGGYNPSLSFPNPQAGTKPSGSDRFSTGVEPTSFDNDRWMPYTYWKDMRAAGDGQYWGNVFLPSNPNIRMARNRWYCVETMVKLNDPVTAANGELAFWIDGQQVLHLGQGFPNGSWSGGIFTENAGGSPFGGFQWRSNTALNLNWLWLQNYVTGVPSTVLFDHVVLASSRIGCLTAAGPGDTTPPTATITAPAAGATVTGSAVSVTATASDAGGVAGVQFKLDGVNLGAEDTSAPYSVTWNSTTSSNAAHTITAVARDQAGNTATSAPVTVTVDNPPSGSPWPNEPSGMTLLNDQPWNLLSGNGWSYLRRTSSKDASIVLDTGAPLSPAEVLRMVFTTDMQRDTEPSVHWIGLPSVREIYTGWWMKVSPNWSCSPAGCGKINFLFTNGDGQVYTNIYHPAAGSGPPFRVGANTEWAPYGQEIWFPNVTTTLVYPGQWHRIEFYYKWETTPGVSGDGIIRWWVDGVLNGNHTNVHYPAAPFIEFQFAPTLQNPPPAEQYLYIDHTRIKRR